MSEADYLAASQRVQETTSKPFAQRPKTIELLLADGSTFPHKARPLSVDRQVKASTGTILVTALLPNPGSVLRPGLPNPNPNNIWFSYFHLRTAWIR